MSNEYSNTKPEVGWDFKPVRTKQEVADLLGISRTRVFQHEQSALAKLKKELEGRYGHTR